MKNKIIILIIFLIVGFTIFVNIGNRSLTCNELLFKKLWVNETKNFSVCIPDNYMGYDAYGHIYNKKNSIFSNNFFDDSLYNIGLLESDKSDLFLLGCFGKKSKKYLLGEIEVLDCFDENTKKYKSTEFNFKDNIFLSFDKNNNEHVNIINSIKTLTEK